MGSGRRSSRAVLPWAVGGLAAFATLHNALPSARAPVVGIKFLRFQQGTCAGGRGIPALFLGLCLNSAPPVLGETFSDAPRQTSCTQSPSRM